MVAAPIGSPPFAVMANPDAHRIPARLLYQLLLLPLVLGGFVLPGLSVVRLAQGRRGDALELFLVSAWYVPAFLGISWLIYGRPIAHWVLARRGLTAMGHIYAAVHRPYSRGPKDYVRFRFDSRGSRSHSGLEAVRAESFDRYRIGDPIEVWYLESAPFLNVPVALCEYRRAVTVHETVR
jgi:hypothetical protein